MTITWTQILLAALGVGLPLLFIVLIRRAAYRQQDQRRRQ